MIICSKILIFCHKIDSSSRIIRLIFSSTREFLPLHNNFVYLRAQRSFQIYEFQRRKTPIFDSTRENRKKEKSIDISIYIESSNESGNKGGKTVRSSCDISDWSRRPGYASPRVLRSRTIIRRRREGRGREFIPGEF